MLTAQPVTSYSSRPDGAESPRSGVSWGAVFAGSVIAAVVSTMLVTGGTGLGFLFMSPWHNEVASDSALTIGSIAWLFVTQIIAYGIAGYVAGRSRTKWTDTASDEIYFRDTAHGFLIWALGAVVGLVLLGSTIASVVFGTAKAGATLAGAGASVATAAAGQAARAGAERPSLDYFTDTLLSPNDPSAAVGQADVHQETPRILARSLTNGELSDADQAYLTKLVAQHAGIDEAAAQQRLKQVEGQAKQVAQHAGQKTREAPDAAHKAAAAFSLSGLSRRCSSAPLSRPLRDDRRSRPRPLNVLGERGEAGVSARASLCRTCCSIDPFA